MKLLLFIISIQLVFTIQAQQKIYFNFNTQNDFLNYQGKGTDRYYTAGNSFGLTFVKNKIQNVISTISISQKIYTPDDISKKVFTNQDYPYAGLLYFTYSRSQTATNSLSNFTYKISTGTTGYKSAAAEVQTTVHKLIHYRLPNGWNQEIDLGHFIQVEINYSKSIIHTPLLKINTFNGLEYGTIFSRANLGTEIKIGYNGSNFLDNYSNIIPSLNHKKSGMYFFIKPSISYVFNNALLNTKFGIADTKTTLSNKKDICSIVLNSSFGISYYTNSFSITLVQNQNSREFNAAQSHAFGEINLLFKL